MLTLNCNENILQFDYTRFLKNEFSSFKYYLFQMMEFASKYIFIQRYGSNF